MKTNLPPNYRPSEDEPFMSPRMVEYFRQRLQIWREEVLKESSETLLHLQEGGEVEPDLADRASLETGRSLELRTRDRQRKLLAKIDAAAGGSTRPSWGADSSTRIFCDFPVFSIC